MASLALLVVDVQTALVNGIPYKSEKVIANIKELIDICRQHDIEVIYIQHCEDDDVDFKVNSEGWQIYKDVAPIGDEKIFLKRYNSAFKDTGLKAYIDSKGIETIILTGMQTEYCIDATCKVAFEYGYIMIIPEMTNTTFDNGIIKAKKICEHYNNIWNNRFAKCISMKKTIYKLTARE